MRSQTIKALLILGCSLIACHGYAGVSSPEAAAAMQARELNFVAAPIKTQEDLREFLQAAGGRSGPFKHLSDAARQRFIESLAFNETGVTTFYTGDIESELSATQAYQLLALFGIQDVTPRLKGLKTVSAMDKQIMGKSTPTLAADHDNYQCVSRATCARQDNYICMSGC